MDSFYLVLFTLIILFRNCTSQLSQSKDELLNWCLKSQNHKQYPGKEDSLHQQCYPWKDRACCTESVTRDIHYLNMYNFTLDHCYNEVKKNMSSQCRRHFIQDNCFYECEPHIGFWVVNTTRKISSERFYQVPICSSECDSWFESCKDDYTCAYNWPQDFLFKNGHNTCPEESKCLKFKDMYESSKEFCENVWDHSWKYTKDEPCLHMWFSENESSVNRKAAEFYIDRAFNAFSLNGASAISFGHTMITVIVVAISLKMNLV